MTAFNYDSSNQPTFDERVAAARASGAHVHICPVDGCWTFLTNYITAAQGRQQLAEHMANKHPATVATWAPCCDRVRKGDGRPAATHQHPHAPTIRLVVHPEDRHLLPALGEDHVD